MMNSGKEAGLLEGAILIAGPTASGKSALALQIAGRLGGAIVNADSMQGYALLDVITARPTKAEMARVPHHLYGHVDPATPYSTGAWLRDVMRLAGSGALDGRRAVFVGGTGLYFRALVEGISEMPEIPAHLRERWRHRLAEEGPARLHAILAREDPAAAAMLRPSDGQRIARALEVLEASGRSILEWQRRRGTPLIDRASAHMLVIEPERRALVERIERRFERMIASGALAEAAAVSALRLDPALPAMKAIGLRELQAVNHADVSLDEAVARAKVATRQYAKRQMTWFRNQLDRGWLRSTSPEAGEKLLLERISPEGGR